MMAVDVPKCPICYEIISEPVVYPCQHEVCKECFERSMETANLWCPLCRKRVSSWARRNVRNPVDAKRRIEIQKVLASPHQDLLENESVQTCLVSKPGEIQQEYLEEVSKVQEERSREERSGEVFAHKLFLEEEAEQQKEKQQLEEDQRMAEVLSQEFILQQIESREKQTAEDHKMAERLSKEMVLPAASQSCRKAHPPAKIYKSKTPKRKSAVHPKHPSPSPSVRPITFWLKPLNQT